ncbi:hypothetical protein N1851_021854 [Merluccius polli]|uniref:Uncharacterized protein n=1 Tax=Merluccius polli TaxID=89951 RepID=A0AA47MJ92_MERPO|nr:hypothetical protein N1851_021854 [Merluccius polli]
MTELLTLSLRESPATLRRKLISAACTRDLVLSAQLPLHHDGSVQSPHYCRRCTDPPVDLPLHPPPTREQDPEVLELLHLGQDLIPDPGSALHPFPVEDHGLGFGGADSHPGCFTLGCEPVQRELEDQSDEANRTTSSAKSRDPILRSPNRPPSTPWLCLEILSIKIMNRIAPEIGEPTPESPGPASLPEGVSVGLRRSSKYSFHRSTTSRVEVSVSTIHSVDDALLPPPETPDGGPEPLQSRPASPNSSHVRVFASVTATAALRLACRYLPAASGVPQAKKVL